MRWDELFADLEGQLATALDQEAAGLDLEEERLRLARLSLRERLVLLGADPAAVVALQLCNGQTLHLRIRSAGRDWVAGALVAPGGHGDPSGAGQLRSVIVPGWSIATVALGTGLVSASVAAPAAEAAAESLSARLGLAFVLRELCRRRALVELDTQVGPFAGTIDRVGRDHLDLAEHDPGVPRRAGAVRRIRMVAFPALLAVRSSAA